jgi:hypothetical protein
VVEGRLVRECLRLGAPADARFSGHCVLWRCLSAETAARALIRSSRRPRAVSRRSPERPSLSARVWTIAARLTVGCAPGELTGGPFPPHR